MTDLTIQKHSYMPGLDGLRALAVFGVIAYHLGLPFVPGGFLGVTLFFVLSGYLITDILLTEWNKDRKINMKSFFIRRGKRLLPSVYFLLICLVAYVTVFRPDLFENLKSEVLPAAFFVSNWWYIFNDIPYFASFATPSLLNHFWSLAVEVQFYLIWPVLLFLMQRFIRKNWVKIALTAAAAVISALLMALLYQPGLDPSRIYYGTDTRVFSLLLGACLAFALPSVKIAAAMRHRRIRVATSIIGFISLLAVIVMSCVITQYDDFLYLGGMLVFSAASALVIGAAASPATIIGKIFAFRPLRYIGKISYGVYLWQFPIIVITNTMMPSNKLNVLLSVCQVAGTLLMATLSYYLIELPIRRRQIIKSLKKASFRDFCSSCLHSRWWEKTAALLVIALVLVSGLGFVNAQAIPSSDDTDMMPLPSQMVIAPTSDAVDIDTPPSVSPSEAVPEPSGTPDTSPSDSPQSPAPTQSAPTESATEDVSTSSDVNDVPPSDAPAAIVPSDLGITFIGDSIGIDIAPDLQEYYPNMYLDAKVGRQFYQAKTIVSDLLASNKLGSTVVIELGSNGSVSESQMRGLIELIGSYRKIVFVNTQVPRAWCDTVNSTLTKVSAEYSNTTVANWYDASVGKSEYFWKDGFHPNSTGSPILAKIVADAIEDIQRYQPYMFVI